MILVFIITFCVLVALGFGAASAWSDFNKLMIPNIYSLLIIGAFVPAFLAITFFSEDATFFGSWKSHLLAFVFTFLVTYCLFFFKLIGGGDAKLITAFSLWTGAQSLIPFLFIMALTGGILGVATLVLNKNKLVKKPLKGSWVALAQKGKKDVPYGIAIFVGALFAFWHAGLIQPSQLMDLAKVTIGS